MHQYLEDENKNLNINQSFSSFIDEQGGLPIVSSTEQKKPIKLVTHDVTIDDTLEGLSLQYGVSPNLIKEYNGLSSDNIYYVKSLKIPNPIDFYQSQQPTEDSLKGFKRLYFVSHVLEGDDKSEKIATYYLESNDWNLEEAAKNYLADLRFEQEHKKNNGKKVGIKVKRD